ncbi:MAG: TolC family protein [Desulfobacteraceae bacterium]|nr:TolC family protein [Desulfobacteraceae bacterium]
MTAHPKLVHLLLGTALALAAVFHSPTWTMAAPLPDHPLAVEEAIRIALSNNLDIRMAKSRVKTAGAALKKARALFMPTLTMFSEYSTGDAPSAYLFKTIDQRELPPGTDFNAPGSFTNLETGVTARINLFRGGRDCFTNRMAESDLRAAGAVAGEVENQIVSMVIRLFFSVLKAGEYVSIAEESVATVTEQLRIMEVRFRGGGVLKSDILSLEVRAAEAQKNLVQSRNLFSTTLNALTTLLSLEPMETLDLATECECPVELPKEYEEAVDKALGTRPEMIKANERVKRARLGIKAARATYLPVVNLAGRYYLDSDDLDYAADKDNYTAAVTLQWDLFTGGTTGQEILQARQELTRVLAFQQKVRLRILTELKNAFLDLADATERLGVAKTSVAMAEETLGLVKKRYQGGSDTVTRYLESELARNRARIFLSAAFYDRKISQSEIARAMGLLGQLWKQEK